MPTVFALMRYLAALSVGKTVLWCYLIWYLATVARYFDPAPAIWLNALGISAVIGTALVLSVNAQGFRQLDPWPTFRLFLMPFCVSSFSSLIKGQGFLVILPPDPGVAMLNVALCASFIAALALLRRFAAPRLRGEGSPAGCR